MEMLVVILLLTILFILLSFKSSVKNNFQKIENELNDLRKLTITLTERKTSLSPNASSVPVKKEAAPKKDYWESGFKVQEEVTPVETSPPVSETEKPKILPKDLQQPKEPSPFKVPDTAQTKIPPRSGQPIPVPRLSFFERHPDLEKFIGENLISKVGIAILVLAIGFFVKYAIDKDWIGPVARVAIGILCGGILITLAHRMRKNYQGFSSVLVGGGLAIFYFTIALAYHQFHLFSQTASFIIMVVITGFAVSMSMLYNRQELAVISLVGGFATPFLVSDGSGNFVTLFTYLLILNTGLLVIAYNRSWRLLNLLSFIFTVILFFSWIVQLSSPIPARTYLAGFWFATAFYVLFFVINIANNIKEKKRFIASDFSILLANTALYFSAGLYFISSIESGAYRGLFTALLGAFNLAASWALFRRQNVDRNIFYLLIGITVSFISLTAPIQLQGNHITLFWASECVLLYWLYQRSNIRIIYLASMVVWLAMLISLLIDWAQFYGVNLRATTIIFNKGFITTLCAAISTYLLFVLRKKDEEKPDLLTFNLPIGKIFRVSGLVLLFVAGLLEINHQFSFRYHEEYLTMQYLLLFTYSFSFIFYVVTKKISTAKATPLKFLYLPAACLIIYLFSISGNFSFVHQALSQKKLSAHLSAHWLAMIVLAIIYFVLVNLVRKSCASWKNIDAITWLLCSWIVIFLSAEVNIAVQTIYFNGPESLYGINRSFVKSGLPILWGLSSFTFMWLGMKHKYRTLRIISLVLFSITLIKLFAFDIRNISAGGKIAAFFCLGVLLLIISFMYQRLKKIIIEDAEKPIA